MTSPADHTRTEKLLLEAARIFNSTLEYESLIAEVLRLVNTALNSEGALLFRVDHDRTDIKIRLVRARDNEMFLFHRDFGTGIIGWVARHREPELVYDATADPRVDPEIESRFGSPIRSVVVVPLIGRGHMIGVVEALNKVDGVFTPADLDILVGLANQIAVAIDNAHLYRVARREALEKELLFEIGKKLSSSISQKEVMREILHSVKRAIDFDAGGVFVIEPAKDIIGEVYTEGYDDPGSEERVLVKTGEGLIGHVTATGEPVIVPDVSVDPRYMSARETTRSEIVVPMLLNNRVVGVLNLESDTPGAYRVDNLSLLQAFAAQAAVSLDRARLHEEILAAKRLEEQLKIAREIQQTFLPEDDPTIPGYDVSGRNVPSGQVGGDYYDFIHIVDYQTGIAIADVSGKGIPAALIMASFRASLIAEIRNNYSIRTIAAKVNNLVYESVKAGSFVTGVYGVLDSRNHIFTFTNCGHNLPFLVRAGGAVEYLREGGQILGVSPNAQYEERPIWIGPGDIILLYTDGVTEVFTETGEEYGLQRLVNLVRDHREKTSQELVDIIHEAVSRWAGPKKLPDDFT
ncbi:MAG TPA: SpoIIE family protein phosphatase, partial [candidate division Zixibacteria bacterium]|nr:SpoIIE family protein phosphatase [candidate division Zixibacteria bacterium]